MTKRVTVKPLMFIEECRNGIFEYNGERLTNNEIVKLIDTQYEEIQQSKVLIKKYYNENADLIKENEQLKEENLKLKRALLFYLDLAIQDSSYLNDGFEKGMELWCQRLFNCSYEQAKEYKDFEWINVWEMGE